MSGKLLAWWRGEDVRWGAETAQEPDAQPLPPGPAETWGSPVLGPLPYVPARQPMSFWQTVWALVAGLWLFTITLAVAWFFLATLFAASVVSLLD
jgi:hypothetical protein